VRDTLTAGTEVVSVASGTPLPGPNTIAGIVGKTRYMPPLISLRAVGERALAAWETAAPQFRPPSGVPGVVSSSGPFEDESLR